MNEFRAAALVGVGLLVALVVTGVVRGLAGGQQPPPPPPGPAPAAVDQGDTEPLASSTTSGAAEEAVALAERVLRADLTGEGREEFGDYWGEGVYRPCCREVVVHSGVARPTGRPETVVVSLVFSAQRIDAGVALEQAGSDVYLVWRNGGWLPVQPNEGGWLR